MSEHKYFVEQLHGFGVTSSYEELRRFKISCASAAAEDCDGIGQIKSANSLVQVVAYNFDAEISSQNGKKMTHGLAMIVTYLKLSSVENHNVNRYHTSYKTTDIRGNESGEFVAR